MTWSHCQAFRCLRLVSSVILSVLCHLPSESDRRTACWLTPWKYDCTTGEWGEVNWAKCKIGHTWKPQHGAPLYCAPSSPAPLHPQPLAKIFQKRLCLSFFLVCQVGDFKGTKRRSIARALLKFCSRPLKSEQEALLLFFFLSSPWIIWGAALKHPPSVMLKMLDAGRGCT